MSTPRDPREAQSDMSTPRDTRAAQSEMSTPRDTRGVLSDITNVTGMLTVFSYASLYTITQCRTNVLNMSSKCPL
jgi:hypothetical protein